MKKAFTLIEILIVVILLGILAAVVIPQFVNQSELANENAAKTTASNLNSCWQQYVASQIGAGSTVAVPADAAAAAALLKTNKYIAQDAVLTFDTWAVSISGTPTTAQEVQFVAAESSGS